MKKTKLCALLVGTVLTSALVLGMAGCTTNTARLYDERYDVPVVGVNAVDALDGYVANADTSSVDAFGLIVLYKDTEATDGGTATRTYALYDLLSDTVVATSDDEGGFEKMTDGLYRVAISSTISGGLDVYEYYGRSGLLISGGKTLYLGDDGRYYLNDGRMVIIDKDGYARLVNSSFDPVFTPWSDEFVELKDVYAETLSSGDEFVRVWSKDGEVLNTYDTYSVLQVPDEAFNPVIWIVGNSAFVQYSIELPDDAADYDYYQSYSKYNLVTKSINFKTGSVSEYDFGAIVEEVVPNNASQEGVFLKIQAINDKVPSSKRILQYYGENGSIRVDLQKLLPGANQCMVQNGYVVISNDVTFAVYASDGKYVASADAAFNFSQGFFFREFQDNMIIYDKEGNEIMTVSIDPSSLQTGDKMIVTILMDTIYFYSVEEDASSAAEQYVLYKYTAESGSVRLGEGTLSGFIYYIEDDDGDYSAYSVYNGALIASGLSSAMSLCGSMVKTDKDSALTIELYSYEFSVGNDTITKYLTVSYSYES